MTDRQETWGELREALEALYQSAHILYMTPETHITIWTMALQRHKQDLERAHDILAKTEQGVQT